MMPLTALLTCFFLYFTLHLVEAFSPSPRRPLSSRQLVISHAQGFAKSQDVNQDDNHDATSSSPPSPTTKQTNKKPKGDSIRSATGIRPSLHPVTINCIAEALLQRSKASPNNSNIDISNPSNKPLEIAIAAGSIAMNAIQQRQSASKLDETTDSFTMEESNAISGRVVGVVMRMRQLEQLLRDKVGMVESVWRYGEEMNYGLIKSEKNYCNNNNNDNNSGEEDTAAVSLQLDEEMEKKLGENLKMNPLLRMNRAECLLALFIETVERPKLKLVGEEVAGGSEVDFVDGDRLEVLLKE